MNMDYRYREEGKACLDIYIDIYGYRYVDR